MHGRRCRFRAERIDNGRQYEGPTQHIKAINQLQMIIKCMNELNLGCQRLLIEKNVMPIRRNIHIIIGNKMIIF